MRKEIESNSNDANPPAKKKKTTSINDKENLDSSELPKKKKASDISDEVHIPFIHMGHYSKIVAKIHGNHLIYFYSVLGNLNFTKRASGSTRVNFLKPKVDLNASIMFKLYMVIL